MNDINIEQIISAASAVIAIISVTITYLVYRLSKLNLQKYDTEIAFINKQMRSNALLETFHAVNDINNKLVEWDLELTDYDENENLTLNDKKLLVWIMHSINIVVYSSIQQEIIGKDYYDLCRRRSLFNIEKLVRTNKKAKDYLCTLLKNLGDQKTQNNRIEMEFAIFLDEIVKKIQ